MEREETGPEFETRALNVARSIHDPLGLQGAVMHGGRERDAIFVRDDSINVYEFTTRRDAAKAREDAKKLRDLLTSLQRQPENAFKSLTGWFVTRDEPTADQRNAIMRELKNSRVTVHAISIRTLQRRLCDSESYLNVRNASPFGSIAYSRQNLPDVKVRVSFSGKGGPALTVKDLADSLLAGERFLLVGEFGVGKSHALRDIFAELRKRHFRSQALSPFPMHINLKDCVGLKTPAEIIRRHAEEIGFDNADRLISAWRAGACTLLLDGFDEIVPPRWLGNASDLKDFRWEALSPVRRLIEESPSGAGVITCGRAHYFSSRAEMINALGYETESSVLSLQDFTRDQLDQYLKLVGVEWKIPEWMPARPLLLGYLVAMGAFNDIDRTLTSPVLAWRKFFHLLCDREARMFTAVRPEIIKQLVSRVATIARSNGEETGPVNIDMLRTAFINVNGREPDAEGSQVLLRLPGLALADSSTEGGSSDEERYFVDKNLADTAYGEDLARYLKSPYVDNHPLSRSASWATAASELAVGVASATLAEERISPAAVLAAAKRRQNNHQFDAVLADALRVCADLGVESKQVRNDFLVEGVLFPFLSVPAGDPILSRVRFTGCVIEVLEMSDVVQEEQKKGQYPLFQESLIGYIDGLSSIPSWLSGCFDQCEIEGYSAQLQTTAGILGLKISSERRIALTILKKIYNQPGSGRREGALSRGLDRRSRELVPEVIAKLVSSGWILRTSGGKETIYVPIKGKRADALRALNDPTNFHL